MAREQRSSGDLREGLVVKILVTGGAGFIGSNIARQLLARGDEVHILDDFSTGRREIIDEFRGSARTIEGDIRDLDACRAACKGMDAILHLAALGSVPRSMEDPVTTHAVNVTGSLNMLLMARECGVDRFVMASSSSVYGDTAVREKSEDLASAPLSPYASSKLAAESYTKVFKHAYGMNTVALRYFNVFGPYQDPQSQYAAVVPLFASALIAGSSPTIFGDGGQTRDFTYVDNVVSANLLALECPPESCGEAYNVACGQSVSVKELFEAMRQRLGGAAVAIEPRYEPPRKGDVRDSLASIAKVREGLRYEPLVSFEEGIARTVDWYVETTSATSQPR